MNRTKLLYVFLTLFSLWSFPVWSQQSTITTTFSNNSTNGEITFNFQNSNSFPVMITGLESIVSVSGTVNAEAWYKPSAINNFPGVISTANGWTQFGSGSINGTANISNTTPQSFFNNLTLVVPANSTYGICVSAYTGNGAGCLRYSAFSTNTIIQSQSGNCYMVNGYYVSFAGPSRPNNTAPTLTPSGFIGNLIYTTPSACSGTPAPGNTLASADSTCSGSTITFSLSTPPFATGITYQWQGSTDSINFATIPNATSSVYTATITGPAYYRCQVSCGSNTAYSTSKYVTTSNYLNCYCTPTSTNGAYSGGYDISNVTINSLNYNSGTPYSPYYINVPEATATTALLIGNTYNLSVTAGSYSSIRVWFDWNHNGTFEPSESILVGSNTGSSPVVVTSSIPVPSTALSGKTKMRVRSSYYSSPLGISDACTTSSYGEAEDYTVTLATPTPCSGTPTLGALVSTADSICPGSSFTLSQANVSTNSGLTYQWQGSTDSISWGNIPNATNTSYTTTLSATTYYRLLVSCGSNTGTSQAKKVVKKISVTCYCTSAAYYATDDEIVNVTVGTMNNNSTCNSTGTTGSLLNRYSNFTNVTPATIVQTQPINFSVQVANCSGNSTYTGLAIFIDYNQDGDFLDANEQVYGSTTSQYSPSIFTGSFAVPSNAVTGTTLMRVINVQGYSGSGISSCLNGYSYGETEDYLININALTPCTGTPVPGATASSSDSVCAGVSFTLSMPSLPYNSGLTYQWQGSTNGGASWGNILNATSPTLTTSQTAATSYRCLVTCNGSASAYSTPVLENMSLFYNCYCAAVSSSGTSSGSYGSITNVSFNTLNNSSSYPSTTPYYTNYPAYVISTTVYTQQAYTLSATQAGSSTVRAWIDWNQNGTYESTESYSLVAGSSAASTGSVSITVPAGAVAGQTKMRIRSNYYGYSLTSTDACTILNYGETEDYFITVGISQPCSGAPSPGNIISSVDSACSGVSFTLSIALPVNTGLSYQWQTSSNGTTWTNITGATSYIYTAIQTGATYYRCIVTCSNGGATTTTSTKYITMNVPTNCYCTPTSTGGTANNYYISSVSFNTLNNTNTYLATAPYYTYYPQTVATTVVTPGSVYTLTTTQPNYNILQAWIDWNQNGSFETTESYSLGSNSTTSSVNITIPATALSGKTRMRIRINNYSYSLTSSDACTTLAFGETEDYTIFVGSNTTCSGTPSPGNTLSSADSVCAGMSFNLTVQNPVLTNGVTYQWQYSPDNITWIDIFNANTLVYSISQSSTYYYRCRVACGTNTAYSTALKVNMGAATNCYCTPQNTAGGYQITNVTLNTLSNNTTSPAAAPFYTYYNTLTTTLNSNNAYTLSITKNYGNSAGVWFDWNRNGLFESSEFTTIANNYNSGTYVVSIAVPTSTTSGMVRMRVRFSGNTTLSGTDACTAVSGETEDYSINVAGTSLAIYMKNITARNIGKVNRLAWETLTETGGDYFILERSIDGVNFSSITTMKSNGKASSYTYDDKNPANGVNYYRLKIVETSGSYHYSTIVKATVKDVTNLIVEAYPNPVNSTLNVSVYGSIGENATIQIIDMSGKIMKSIKLKNQQMSFGMSDTAPGLYLLKYTDTKNTQTIKINKQ